MGPGKLQQWLSFERRLMVTTLISLCASLCVLTLGVVSAHAAVTHDYLKQITEVPAEDPAKEPVPLSGPLSEPSAMTIDAGELYVLEAAEGAGRGLNRFNASSGAFISQFPKVSSLFSLKHGVAVGHATGESEVYVAGDEPSEEGSKGVVAVFDTAGTLKSVWNGANTPSKTFGCLGCGRAEGGLVAIDNSSNPTNGGDVYVASPVQGVVDIFKPEAGGKEPEQVVGQLTGTEPGVPFADPTGVVVDGSSGNVLVIDGAAVDVFEPVSGMEGVYTLLFTLTGTPHGTFGQIFSVAVDASNGEIYVAEETEEQGAVDQFSSSGAFLVRITGADTPAGNLQHPESVAVDSASHDLYVGDRRPPTAVVDVFGPDIVVPDVTTALVSNLAPTSATLNGTVNPDNEGNATCQFVWGTTKEFGNIASCSGDVPNGSGAVEVHAELAGLERDTEYCYRLQATNKNGTNPGEPPQDKCFTTPGAGIHEASVTEVTAESATFQATIDPNNAPTTYFFEYGTGTDYGASVPASPGAFLGSEKGDVQATPQHAQGLEAHTLYHYHVVAISEVSAGYFDVLDGPDETFLTRTVGGEAALPDNRQWEQVSPVDKRGALIEPITESGVIQAAANGGAISYFANAPTEAHPAGYSNSVQVLSTRGAGGWGSLDIATPNHTTTGVVFDGEEYRFFSSDLSLGVVQPIGGFTSLSPEASEQTAYLRTNYPNGDVSEPCTTACYRPLVIGCPPVGQACTRSVEEHADVPPGTLFGNGRTESKCGNGVAFNCRPMFRGGTRDLRHVVLESDVGLKPGTPGPTGDDLYEWSAGQLSLVGGIEGELAFRAISDDGARVVFDGVSEGLTGLLMRNTVAGRTVQLDAAEPECLADPGTKCASGGGKFMFASDDGSRVFFIDAQRLTRNAGASGGSPDLYECEMVQEAGMPKCNLSDVTPAGPKGEGANALGMLGASSDGSWVYYVTEPSGAAPHLYVRRGGETALIGVLSVGDRPDWEGPRTQSHTARVSPNGRWLAFMSQSSLTGYDNRDAASRKMDEQVYLYDANAGRLVCASCNPTGARPSGVEAEQLNAGQGGLAGGVHVWPDEQWIAANVPGETPYAPAVALYQARYLSNSGRLFFNSSDALVPQDVNRTEDVYEYEPVGVLSANPSACSTESVTFSARSNGCIGLISSGTSPTESAFLDASETGGDVFFLSSAKLVSKDVDSNRDVYDAHECSAQAPCFPAPATVPPPCGTGDSCKAAPSVQPDIFGLPASATLSGGGNVALPSSATGRPLSRAQLLARTLKACRNKHGKKRVACEKRARRRYGPPRKAKRSAKPSRGGKQ